jgi:hypothetical protein
MEMHTMTLAEGTHNGFNWAVKSNAIGYRCGYVDIPKGHPWFGNTYPDVDCHGGITFAKSVDDFWRIGFDCAHLGDRPDPELPGYRKEFDDWSEQGSEVRTQDYVERQCRAICDQALAAAHTG